MEGGLLLYSNNSNSGLVYWNEGAKTAVSIYGSGGYYSIIHQTQDGYLLSSTNSSYTGIIYFEPSTESGEKVWSSSYNWSDFEDADGGCRIYQKYTHFVKALFWSDEDKQITES